MATRKLTPAQEAVLSRVAAGERPQVRDSQSVAVLCKLGLLELRMVGRGDVPTYVVTPVGRAALSILSARR
jgi:hypothetical protein